MATRLSIEPHARPDQLRPEPGQILIVIHDFSARSSDELSLLKGDRVELIERDDDFGDGWYLGRHLTTGNSGLFPEVYTRIAPRGPSSYPPIASQIPRSPITLDSAKEENVQRPAASNTGETTLPIDLRMSAPTPEKDKTPQASRHVSASEILDSPNITSPLTTTPKEPEKAVPPAILNSIISLPPKSVTDTAKLHVHGQDSPVMNETLSVIDEHITDMNSPHHSAAGTDRRGTTNDSGSEYSSHLDQRLSYINGEETDEEEEALHTQAEVTRWTPDQVAEYLFTVGVDTKHCEVFRDQEITGDVLLGMDQTSVFLKEFDLGSVGRRLKVWQKIKNLQDEIGGETSTRRNTGTYGSDVGSEEGGRHGSRSMTSSAMLPRIPSLRDRPASRQNTRLSQQHNSRSQSMLQEVSPVSPKSVQGSPRPTGEKRPSAASIRDLHHSRQNSANDFTVTSLMSAVAGEVPKSQDATHKKQHSFDRNWTMGAAASPPLSSLPSRPLSSSGIKGVPRSSTDQLSQSTAPSSPFDALDRGYFSGNEADARQRNVLRKRGSTTTHSRNSSYTDEQRVRSATAHSRHSRFGSVDSIRDSAPPSAAQKYYGLTVNGRRRTPSENSISAPPRPAPPPKDAPSPTVTKLEETSHGNTVSPKLTSRGSDWFLPTKSVKSTANRHFGLRAISDAVTGHEKSSITSPADSPVKQSPLQSPSRTTSSTTSAGPSLDLDSPDASNVSTMATPGSARAARKKSKKETSAYTRGLEKKPPQEQMVEADYSGWMKKKSTNLMTTWKPRLFILKGRRLSYYYSEDDQEEKGLIDISFHKVLPASGDRLTGLHATLTGATNSPTSPPGTHTPTLASAEADAEAESTLTKGAGDSMFIFKLVPPRAGLSRAVTFTKPTVHYFAVPNLKQGRLWMAAIMKATIDRDESAPLKTTYTQKTISLAKARAMRQRPPALMNLDEHVDEEAMKTPASDKNGLNIQGIIFDRESHEADSGVSGVSKSDAQQPENAVTAEGTVLANNSLKDPEPHTA
ncbi:Protein BOB1 [Lachnellula hyalina]|uniref:Protein BOB1 n=1 Tax=Lachnellula hyalina TaxID=1316788 RepID=A0A8H8U5E8_9HELO|nr:Protein BOB1 [Lachnellula hyalina]TVY31154.1 Protein BOB1 [Lachnellula hyalina]